LVVADNVVVVKGGVDYCLLNLAGLMEMLVFGRNSSGGVSCDFKDFSNCAGSLIVTVGQKMWKWDWTE
jgi:hypothetical protein